VESIRQGRHFFIFKKGRHFLPAHDKGDGKKRHKRRKKIDEKVEQKTALGPML
jgi:hypothetical protein